jgi:hypothetical protein
MSTSTITNTAIISSFTRPPAEMVSINNRESPIPKIEKEPSLEQYACQEFRLV